MWPSVVDVKEVLLISPDYATKQIPFSHAEVTGLFLVIDWRNQLSFNTVTTEGPSDMIVDIPKAFSI